MPVSKTFIAVQQVRLNWMANFKFLYLLRTPVPDFFIIF